MEHLINVLQLTEEIKTSVSDNFQAVNLDPQGRQT